MITTTVAHYLLLIGVAAGVTLLLTPYVRLFSVRLRILDVPTDRAVHKRVKSRLGGVAMFTGFVAVVVVQLLGERYWGWHRMLTRVGPQLWGLLAGIVVIFIVGVIDDIRGLRPGWKLAGQIVAALCPIAAGLTVEYVANPFGGLVQLGLLALPLSLVWIVGFTNVINLIDGLDGLAAGVCAIAAVSFLVLAEQMNTPVAAVLASAMIGSCLGFLRYNFHPASIMMGDSGSLFLGFTLAVMSMSGVMKSVAAVALAVPLMIVGVPLMDTVSAIVRRWRGGRPIQEADAGHVHHRLLYRGFDQRQTVLVIYGWTAALAVGAYAMRYLPAGSKVVLFVLLAALSAVVAYWLGLFETAHAHDQRGEEEE